MGARNWRLRRSNTDSGMPMRISRYIMCSAVLSVQYGLRKRMTVGCEIDSRATVDVVRQLKTAGFQYDGY